MGKRAAEGPRAKPKRGRGGYVQRLRAAELEEAGELGDILPAEVSTASGSNDGYCALTAMLVGEVLWGALSPARAQKYAQAAVASGTNTGQIKKMARMGTSGMHSRNVWRDLKVHLGPNIFGRALRIVQMPLQIDLGRVVQGSVGIIYPHLLLAQTYQHFRGDFVEILLGGSVDKVAQFWGQMADHPAFRGHPMHHHQQPYRTKGIPASLHGDGTVTTGLGKAWGRMADALSWASCLMGPCKKRVGHFVMILMLEQLMVQMGSMTADDYWRELAWSFYWAYQGLHPDRDSNNRLYQPGCEEYDLRLRRWLGATFWCFGCSQAIWTLC